MADFTKETQLEYKLKSKDNGVYAFLIEGNAVIEHQELEKRDGFGIWNTDMVRLTAKKDAKILLMEVPMRL